MMKRYLPLTLLILVALACSLHGLVPGDPVDRPFGPEEIDPESLTATLKALDTVIAQTTAEAAAQAAPTETPAPDSGDFCEVYAEYVIDLETRITEYETLVAAGEPAHDKAVAADESIEAYMDQLAPIAPEEVRAEVELLANMSLIGLLSSQEVFPEAELALSYVDDYATANCDVSFGE